MAAFTSIAIGIGLAVSAAGIGYQAYTASKAAKAQKEASTRAENLREQQNQLDAQRRRRQAYRESILARAAAVSGGVNAGAGLGGSGVLAGAGNAITTGLQNQQTVTSSQFLGAGVFQANRDSFAAGAAGQAGQAWGGALTSLGGAIINNAGTIGRVGNYMTAGSKPLNLASFTNVG